MKLLYFAWLRARIGCAEEDLPLPPRDSRRGRTARLAAGARAAAMPRRCSDLAVVRVAVNQDYVGLDHPVRDGDEVAIFPPVTGG